MKIQQQLYYSIIVIHIKEKKQKTLHKVIHKHRTSKLEVTEAILWNELVELNKLGSGFINWRRLRSELVDLSGL